MRLDPATHHHRNDPATAVDAAHRALDPDKVTACERAVMSVFNAHRWSGLCDFELERLLPEFGHTAKARRVDLRDGGYIAATDRTRTTPRGSKATVWMVTEDGIDWCHRWEVPAWSGARLSEMGEQSGEKATAVRLAGECPLCGRQFIGRPGLCRHLRATKGQCDVQE